MAPFNYSSTLKLNRIGDFAPVTQFEETPFKNGQKAMEIPMVGVIYWQKWPEPSSDGVKAKNLCPREQNFILFCNGDS